MFNLADCRIVDYLEKRSERDLNAAIERATEELDPELVEQIVSANET